LAYDQFASYVDAQEEKILRERALSFVDIYGAFWRHRRELLVKYYVKHIACRLAEARIQVSPFIIDYLDGRRPYLLNLDMRFAVKEDVVAMITHSSSVHDEAHGGGMWLGDVEANYSETRGVIYEAFSHYGYRWLWLYYEYSLDNFFPVTNFGSEVNSLPGTWSVDPDYFSDYCRECNPDAWGDLGTQEPVIHPYDLVSGTTSLRHRK
jgi:hypothetical protein